jgi:ubiquinone/menaquinone biosynthesis C-methylase UbiE
VNPDEQRHVIQRYSERIRKYGADVRALGWRDTAQQALRFEVLTEGSRVRSGESVLDIGCGFGDLDDFLRARGIEAHYTGCDISADVLTVARARHPDRAFEERDVLRSPYPPSVFDHVFISGIFNYRIADNMGFLESMLRAAFAMAASSVAANMLTEQVDYREPALYYYSPEAALKFARGLTRHVALRHDYPLYEFSLFLHRTGASSGRGVSSAGTE